MMGPHDPLNILSVAHVNLSRGVRRTTVTYPDGLEIEFRIRLPASMETVGVAAQHFPEGAWLCSVHMDEGADGITYAYSSYWIPCCDRASQIRGDSAPLQVGEGVL